MDSADKFPKETNAVSVELFEVWKEYERIAMHFNELIIQLRVRALAGVAAISALFGFFLKGESSGDFHWGILVVVLVMLILVWIAIWFLDIRYYDRLLVGAVRAIIEIEKASKTGNKIAEINMSHQIEQAVSVNFSGLLKEQSWGGRQLFYVIVLIMLAFGASFSFYQHSTKSDKNQASSAVPVVVPSTPPS